MPSNPELNSLLAALRHLACTCSSGAAAEPGCPWHDAFFELQCGSATSVGYITAAPQDADLDGTEQMAVFPRCWRNAESQHLLRRVRIPRAGLATQLDWYGRALFGYTPARRWALWEPGACAAEGSTPVRIMEAEEVYPIPCERAQAFAPYDLNPGQYCHVRRNPAREIRDGGHYVCTLFPV